MTGSIREQLPAKERIILQATYFALERWGKVDVRRRHAYIGTTKQVTLIRHSKSVHLSLDAVGERTVLGLALGFE